MFQHVTTAVETGSKTASRYMCPLKDFVEQVMNTVSNLTSLLLNKIHNVFFGL